MEQEENFITKWNELFDCQNLMVNSRDIDICSILTEEKNHYQIIKQYPGHVNNCNFWHNDVQKQCFIIRLNPESYAYFPDYVRKQHCVISTLLTTNYSASNNPYNYKGYYHKLTDEIKNKQGFLNLALIYHPYVYLGLPYEKKKNPENIKKAMLGLNECKLSLDKVLSVIKAIPLDCLKKYLSENKNCAIFSEIIFEENEIENMIFWNSVKEYLYNDIDFVNMFEPGLKDNPDEQIKVQKSHIRNIYIYLNFERLERRLSSTSFTTPRVKKI